MPARDGTGPNGMGGWCTRIWKGRGGRNFGGGFGRSGMGRGRNRDLFFGTGLPHWERQETDGADDVATLKNLENNCERQLEQIRQKIKELGESR